RTDDPRVAGADGAAWRVARLGQTIACPRTVGPPLPGPGHAAHDGHRSASASSFEPDSLPPPRIAESIPRGAIGAGAHRTPDSASGLNGHGPLAPSGGPVARDADVA